jgi:glycerol kinase
MVLQNADILRAMEQDLGKRMQPLRVDGGASSNNLLMQIQSNILGRKLIRPAQIETTVSGACYLAGLGVGLWQNPAELRKVWQVQREFSVEMTTAARRKRLASWNKALAQALL